ncbi:CPBP family intramembrane glutamic endopeptidase [Curtobacterium sp. VKM Ac-2887]|uniref:CPBP family intramembrane glutamic endopeptidase n=1 Tax=Curtobacterium sp. VKM Ac-2887 TaxID=2783819 RepID=UPI001889EB0B|nr:CPBP family intramembrane glutamic endopeptidase [Curtobacterium sp. VKM Ac-2887]MBF4587942.1 CPBP family intramembrane metalloprotease [Curtobacterium sp. VKM Ac-2887]
MTTTPPRWRVLLDAVFAPQLDALGVEPVPADKNRTGLRVAVWIAIVGLFLLGWGAGTGAAIATLFGWVPNPPPLTNDPVSLQTQVTHIASQLLVASFAGWAMFAWKRPRRPIPFSHGLATVPVYILTMALGFILVGVVSTVLQLPQHDYPWAPVSAGPAFALATIDSALPGPAEELALLGLVVVGLRRAGYSWGIVYLVAIAVRVPFHLYYGWGAIAIAVWPAIAVYLYRRSGAIWGLVVGHALWDLTSFLTVHTQWPAVELRMEAAGIGAVVLLFILLKRVPAPATALPPPAG